MFIHEYGSRDDPTVILLAPMRLEGALQFGVGDGCRKWCSWKLIRDDMVLDNKYLTEILTEGKYPARLSVEGTA